MIKRGEKKAIPVMTALTRSELLRLPGAFATPFLRLCDQSPQRVTNRARGIYPLILLPGPSQRAVVSLKYE